MDWQSRHGHLPGIRSSHPSKVKASRTCLREFANPSVEQRVEGKVQDTKFNIRIVQTDASLSKSRLLQSVPIAHAQFTCKRIVPLFAYDGCVRGAFRILVNPTSGGSQPLGGIFTYLYLSVSSVTVPSWRRGFLS